MAARPSIVTPPPNPFEQAIIRAAQAAAAKQQAQPVAPKPPPVVPAQPKPAPAVTLPKMQPFTAPIPGAAPAAGTAPAPPPGGPAAGTPTPPTTTVNPDLVAQAQLSEQQAAAANAAITGLLAQQPPRPAPYQQPAMPPRNMGQDIGTALGALLFRHAIPAFSQQANANDATREKRHAEDLAAAQTSAANSMQEGQLEQQGWNDKLVALRAQAAQGDAHAAALLKAHDTELHNAAIEQAKVVALGQAATKIADNRDKFANTFSATIAKLGLQESKQANDFATQAAKQASLDTYRYYALGFRADSAFNLAQLRSATELTVNSARIADADTRANASNATRVQIAGATNDLRRDIAGDANFRALAVATLRSIDDWTKTTMALPPAQRAQAVAQMQAQLNDPNSKMGSFMAQMQARGLLGNSVGGAISAEIGATYAGQMLSPTGQPLGGTTVNVNLPPTTATAPAAAPPAATPPAPPGKTISKAGVHATAQEHGWTDEVAAEKARAAGYTITP